MAQFTNVQGFPIDARQFLKENTPAIKFPQFQAKINEEGIYAGQYTAFDWGNRPSDTPANTPLMVLPSQIIRPVKDGFGLRVQRYYKKKTAFIQTMKILRQIINEQKKNYSAGLAMDRRRRMEERVRSLVGDVRGMTPEMASAFMEISGPPNNRAIEANDVNSLVRGVEGQLLGPELSTTLDDRSVPMGGTAGASQRAIEDMGMADKYAQLEGEPTGEEDLPAPMAGEVQERLMDSVEALKTLSQRAGISQDLKESFALSGASGDDLLGLGQGAGPLAERFALTVEDLADDEDLLAYEPGMGEEELLSLVGTETTFEEDLARMERETQAEEALTQQTGRQEIEPLGKGMTPTRRILPPREARGRARRDIGEMIAQGALGRVRARGKRRKKKRREGQMGSELTMAALEARLEGLMS